MKALSVLPALPTVGRIVLVTLSEDLAGSINRDPAIRGNACIAGDVYPLIIARVWPKDTYADGLTVNGQLILDGTGTHWMTSVHYGDEPGCWHWPKMSEDIAAELMSVTNSEAPLKQPSGASEILARDDHQPDAIDRIDGELSAPGKCIGRCQDWTVWRERALDAEKRLADETVKLYGCTAEVQRLTDLSMSLSAERDEKIERERKLSDRLRVIHGLVSDL